MIIRPTTSAAERRRSFSTRHALPFALTTIALAAVTGCGTTQRTDVDAMASTPTSTVETTPPTTTTAPASVAPATTPPTSVPVSPVAPEASGSGSARPTHVRDEMVPVNGTRMHLHCEGAGSSTVVLIAGFESSSESWAVIAPALAENSRVCSYDRPGLGSSGPATTVRTFVSHATDLDTMLTTAGEPGPYLLVGHSFGGAVGIEFARQFTDTVTGLVLVDASPADWAATLCAIADDGTDAATFIRGMCDGWSDPEANAEHLDVFSAFDELTATPSLGSLPVTVVTAVERELPPDIADAERSRLTEAWDRGQEQLAALSTSSRQVSVADTSHYIQIDQPTVVIDEIAHLLP